VLLDAVVKPLSWVHGARRDDMCAATNI
jgi:hypothetical protein